MHLSSNLATGITGEQKERKIILTKPVNCKNIFAGHELLGSCHWIQDSELQP